MDTVDIRIKSPAINKNPFREIEEEIDLIPAFIVEINELIKMILIEKQLFRSTESTEITGSCGTRQFHLKLKIISSGIWDLIGRP